MTTIVSGNAALLDINKLFQMPIEQNSAATLPIHLDFHGKTNIRVAIQGQPAMIGIGTVWNG